MYYDRHDDATTSKLIQAPHIVLCHTGKEKFTCINDSAKLVETNQPKGIQNNFNYGLSMLDEDEWCVFLSDDLVCGKVLVDGRFVDEDVNVVLDRFIRLVNKADKTGVKLVGMNSTGNPFYAKKKYSKYGLVDGRCFAIKKTGFTFHDQINTIPDYYASAFHLRKYGGNLIANEFFLDFKRYETGGLGTLKERIGDKMKDVKIMLSIFPENIRIKDKPNQPKGSHIIIKR